MILLALPATITETVPVIERLGCRSWRWALIVEPTAIVIEQQVRFGREGPKWCKSTDYYGVWVSRTWRGFGLMAMDYNGCHHMVNLGFIQVSWCSHFSCDSKWWRR